MTLHSTSMTVCITGCSTVTTVMCTTLLHFDLQVSNMVSRELEKECIVVFDEAHNIDNVCIEVSGPQLIVQKKCGAAEMHQQSRCLTTKTVWWSFSRCVTIGVNWGIVLCTKAVVVCDAQRLQRSRQLPSKHSAAPDNVCVCQ